MAARKLPPSPPGLPIIGNMHQVLAGESIYKTLWNLSQKYGPAMLLHFGSQQILLISSSEMANQVLKTNDHELSTRPQSKAAKRMTYNYLDVSFSPSDDHWRDMRKVLVSELLIGKRNKMFKNKLEIEMDGFVRSLLSQPSGTIVNLDDALYSLLEDVTCLVAFGKSHRGKTFNGKNLKEIFNETIVMLGGSLADFFPIVGPILDELRGWNRRLEKSFSDADGFLQMLIDEHFEHNATNKTDDEKCFVDDCISRLTNDEIKAVLMVLVSELLIGKRNKMFKNKLEIEMDGFVRSLLSQPSGTIVNLDDALYSLLEDVTCLVAFGKSHRGKTFNGKNLKEIFNETIVMLGGSLADFFPIVGPILDELRGWNRRLEKSFSDADGFLQMLIDEHFEHNATNKTDDEKCFVDDCISRLTNDEIKAVLMNVLNGAIDTSSTTAVWAMSEIVKSPRIMEKLQKEIRSCVGTKSKVHESDIAKMAYLKMVVKETLRLHGPASFLIGRECVSHCKVGGYDVYPGTKIMINVWGIGRDSRTWKERPNEFWPERFENFKFDFLGKHCEMIPFGGGRRACPGYNSGIATVEFILANLLYVFDWEVPGGVKNQDLDMEEYGSWHIDRKTPLCLVPKEHQGKD
nr:cytochrome P450 71B37-like [Tanacetum cinerariifolium]